VEGIKSSLRGIANKVQSRAQEVTRPASARASDKVSSTGAGTGSYDDIYSSGDGSNYNSPGTNRSR
jgi:hypothetical protein